MKTFLFLFAILCALPSLAISGEVTGHAKSMPISKIEVIITEHESIPKKDIEDIQVNGTPIVGNIQVIRFRGQYITFQDIKGVIFAP